MVMAIIESFLTKVLVPRNTFLRLRTLNALRKIRFIRKERKQLPSLMASFLISSKKKLPSSCLHVRKASIALVTMVLRAQKTSVYVEPAIKNVEMVPLETVITNLSPLQKSVTVLIRIVTAFLTRPDAFASRG